MGTNNVLSGAYEPQADGSAIIRCDGWSLPGVWRDANPPRDPADIRAVVRVETVAVSSEPTPTSHPLDVEGCIYLGDKWEYRLKRGAVRLRAQGHSELSSDIAHCTVQPAATWLFNP